MRLLEKIYCLDPSFVVDHICEPNPRARWVIQRIGLPAFLGVYGRLRRLRDALPSKRDRPPPRPTCPQAVWSSGSQ
jgi:hypothetical protein